VTLENAKQIASNRWTIGAASGAVTLIITLGSGILYIDNRYAKAEEVFQYRSSLTDVKLYVESVQSGVKQTIDKSLRDFQRDFKLHDLALRIQETEDELFALEAIPQGGASPQDNARQQRLIRRLDAMRQEQRVLRGDFGF